MKTISYWASRHILPARLLIVILHVVVLILSVSLGLMLFLHDIRIPQSGLVLIQLLTIIAFILYPVRGRLSSLIPFSYRRQKRFDAIILLCGVILFAGWINRLAFEPLMRYQTGPTAVAVVYRVDPPATAFEKRHERREMRSRLRVWKEEIKTELKAYKHSRHRMSPAEASGSGFKGLAVLGLIVVAVFVLRGIAALSCSLSCSGYGAAAGMVFLGGIAIIVLLSVVAVRGIEGRRKRKVPEKGDAMKTPASAAEGH